MAQRGILFSNYDLTKSAADQGRLISFAPDMDLQVGVQCTAVSGAGAQAVFKVQWSPDGKSWTDDPTPLGTLAAPGIIGGRFTVRGLFWRLSATVSGSPGAAPVLTCHAGAIW
jgi:hypothetical protein